MQSDKERWNKRFQAKPFRKYVEGVVEKYICRANVGNALDIAAGEGRNTHFLADSGLELMQ